MKKETEQLLRLQAMIESDRVVTSDNFMELVSNDLSNLLKDYFDYKNVPQISIIKNGNGYELRINLQVLRIKNFASIPK